MGVVNTILQSGNQFRIQKAQFEAAETVKRATNKKEAARTALADFARSLGNTIRIEAAGKEFNEQTSQLASTLEARSTNRINTSLMAAEQMGALAAKAGAAGVGGSSIELLNATIKIQKEITEETQNLATDRLATAGSRAKAQTMTNAFNTIDLTQTFGSFDHTVNVAPKPMKNKLGALLGTAVATYFGGPAAGQAVAGFAVGSWQASNGNFAGATQSFDTAIQNAVTGFKTFGSLQGGPGAKSWFGAVTQKSSPQAKEDESTTGKQFGAQWDWLFN